MLLDELMARRDRVDEPEVTPPPALTIDPVAVPAAGDVGRRAARQRLAELEDVAYRNLRSAEEARKALALEHSRLQHESSARAHAQQEADALRRELDRLHTTEVERSEQTRARATEVARAELADEYERVVEELSRVRGALSDHDGLLNEYAQRLREEQQSRASMRAQLEEAERVRLAAERALEEATDKARTRAEDELIQLTTLETKLLDARAELAAKDSEISRLRESVDPYVERAEAAEEALVRARADGDRLRAHAAALGDELAQLRAQVVALQAAAPAPLAPTAPLPAVTETPPGSADPARPPLARRRPKAERKGAPSAAGATEPTPLDNVTPLHRDESSDDSSERPRSGGDRRTAMKELTAIATASSDDDFAFRRR
jgi:DNA repair exonuclease SbcCD ATPase subunit